MTFSNSNTNNGSTSPQASPNINQIDIISDRIGPNYQVEIPDFSNVSPPDDYKDDSILIWQPNPERIDDKTTESYLIEANNIGFDPIKALTVLYKWEYDSKAAIEELNDIKQTNEPN